MCASASVRMCACVRVRACAYVCMHGGSAAFLPLQSQFGFSSNPARMVVALPTPLPSRGTREAAWKIANRKALGGGE